jgi:RNA recognition motif-containing protein
MSNNTKIFVGNVPFQCTQEEFKGCFKNVPGFINAEIVNKYNTNFSRGFGFVTLKTDDDAQKLIQRNDIVFKDRVLRFTEYNINDKLKLSKFNRNYLFIKNVSDDINRDDIKKILSEYGEVGICFINTNIKTGEPKNTAIAEIKDDQVFEKLLQLRNISYQDKVFMLSKWKNNFLGKEENDKKRYTMDPNEIYRIAFNAGVNVGRLEGLHFAKKHISHN